jgi:hypothetical protein
MWSSESTPKRAASFPYNSTTVATNAARKTTCRRPH